MKKEIKYYEVDELFAMSKKVGIVTGLQWDGSCHCTDRDFQITFELDHTSEFNDLAKQAINEKHPNYDNRINFPK